MMTRMTSGVNFWLHLGLSLPKYFSIFYLIIDWKKEVFVLEFFSMIVHFFVNFQNISYLCVYFLTQLRSIFEKSVWISLKLGILWKVIHSIGLSNRSYTLLRRRKFRSQLQMSYDLFSPFYHTFPAKKNGITSRIKIISTWKYVN